MANKRNVTIAIAIVLVLFIIMSTQITVFVVPPIGAVPQGGTLVISRLNRGQFIDSADAMCERIQGGVNLLCRGVVLGAVAKNAVVFLRLPYIESLYLISTDGKTYGN